MYAKQLDKGKSFGELKDVYALCLVNDVKAFPKYGNEYIQEYYFSMVFIVLPNYTPQNRAEKKMHDLWLRFLTKIDENTDDADPELLANGETFEALELLRRSAFTPGELLAYNQYWLNISTEKSAMERERAEGRAEGREEGEKIGIEKGIEKGRADAMREMARTLKSLGKMTIDEIAEATGLSPDELTKI